MKVIRPADQWVEVQGVDENDTVVVCLGDGQKVVIERLHSSPILTISFGNGRQSVQCYDSDGEDLGELTPVT